MDNNWFKIFAEQNKKELLNQENILINNLLSLVEINYQELLKNIIYFVPHKNLNLNIIIPVKGRRDNLEMVVNRFLINLQNLEMINITVVENSPYSEHLNFCKKNNFNYIWIPLSNSGHFNKSLCMNIGSVLVSAKSYLFHDVDLIFSDTFLEDVLENYDNKVLQCFSEKNIFNLDENQTKKLLSNKINLTHLLKNTESLNSNYTWLPPGGSILINSEMFFEVGGFDDNIFEGWGHEDAIFKLKILNKFNIDIPPCKSPIVSVIHLFHPIENENKKNLTTLKTFYSLDSSIINKIITNQSERLKKLKDYPFNNF